MLNKVGCVPINIDASISDKSYNIINSQGQEINFGEFLDVEACTQIPNF